MKKTIVFIHGMFQNPKSWEKWIAYFNEKGYDLPRTGLAAA